MEQETQDSVDERKPLLIYDGDCGFCAYWVRYWQKLTGDKVAYAPYQEVGGDYPDIAEEQFRGAVQYIDANGRHVAGGAEASYRTLANAPGKGFWLTLYRKMPGFAAVTEAAYAFIAKRRPFFYKISMALWGKDYAPPQYDLVSWLYLRFLGLVFLSAFISFGVQADILIGPHGVLPLNEFVTTIQNNMGAGRFWRFPMVFWLNDSMGAIRAVCWGGAVFSVLLTAGVLQRTSMVALYILYLSLVVAGQVFMSFQWDLLLVEMGLMGLILSIVQRPGIWLLRMLAFFYILASGLVKFMSGDPSWHNFTALDYHFETQPLPTPLAYYAHNLPEAFLHFGTGAALFIELFLPFLIWFPRRLRFVSAGGFALLQVVIMLTGNYNFFNLLSLMLCLILLDDAAVRWMMPGKLAGWVKAHAAIKPAPVVFQGLALVVAAWIALASAVQFNMRFINAHDLPSFVNRAVQAASPLELANTYGPFAVMTKTRPEIVIEGSDDGRHWHEYDFWYKPGNVKRGTSFNIPHQPRIDWQMWFAAMDDPRRNPWFIRLMIRILEGQPEVKQLFRQNPFPDKPPIFVRALLYQYHFATPEQRKADKVYWTREPDRIYLPPAHLNPTGQR